VIGWDMTPSLVNSVQGRNADRQAAGRPGPSGVGNHKWGIEWCNRPRGAAVPADADANFVVCPFNLFRQAERIFRSVAAVATLGSAGGGPSNHGGR